MALLAAVLLALVGVHPSGPASAEAAQSVKTYQASSRAGSLVAYRLNGVKAGGIRKARLSTKRRWQRIPLSRARRGARRGLLVVRASRKLLRPGTKTATDTKFTTPKLVIVQEDGSVSLADPIDTTGTTQTPPPSTQPAVEPVPEAPAPPAPGACAFGTFDVGNWPGACWRPYSDDSPFNQKLPENPRLVANSSQMIQRITGFGPMENFTAGDSGSSDDYGDPVFWSRATDPVYTVHCVEDWGTCEVEGDTVRIPDPAQAAGGTDGHMTVIDQATGWEYDFWAVKSKPRGGGQIDIGWGGKTRIDGLGLDSSATAAGFGNLAGKLRAEELAEGHIDHALFLAISCSNGKVVSPVDPAHGHAGRRCSQIGQSEVDAPPMGTRVQLDMTLAEIDALQLAPWKKTILRALREYGAIMGDTGSSWAIATESGSTYTSFGHEDKWVSFAKSAGVEYYAPESVYVFKMRNDIDWRSRLRVVDPCVSARTC
ncbi:MAG TPA: hypothetical protein VF587_05715 [Solirubrobacteraceae bacterium]